MRGLNKRGKKIRSHHHRGLAIHSEKRRQSVLTAWMEGASEPTGSSTPLLLSGEAPDLGVPRHGGDPSRFWLVLEFPLALSTSLLGALTNRDLLASEPTLLPRFQFPVHS